MKFIFRGRLGRFLTGFQNLISNFVKTPKACKVGNVCVGSSANWMMAKIT